MLVRMRLSRRRRNEFTGPVLSNPEKGKYLSKSRLWIASVLPTTITRNTTYFMTGPAGAVVSS